MHIVTFYSYKGGVGRTMALVNAAAVLAQRGRKVLIVDFDLEAPGISTYKPFQCLTDCKGVVEYVSEYLATAVAPRAEEFIAQSRLGGENIWAMPAGRRNREYSALLTSIDWQALYSLNRGFLFFEDLKQQWKALDFDYVLIDSRTGHTDVGGICTRQLPDAVVLMFFPNDQNLVGLESVVKDIRDEPKGLRREKITLHFCASNVPDLDDEDHILERKLAEAKKALGYKANPAIIRHYNSLTLLEQSLFVLDRPQSKLTSEYKGLTNLVVSENLEDPDGAIDRLRKLGDEVRQKAAEQIGVDSSISATLEEIGRLHPKHGQVAWLMGRIYSLMGNLNAETRCLSIAIDAGYQAVTARRRRAAIARLESRSDDALSDLYAILVDEHASSFEFIAAAELLREFDPAWIAVVANSLTFRTLDAFQSIRLAEILMSDARGSEMAVSLMEKAVASSEDEAARRLATIRLALALIHSKQFERAAEVLAQNREQMLASSSVVEVFNYAMAEWGRAKVPPADLMKHVLSLAGDYRDVNRHQCLALAYSICGQKVQAKTELEGARTLNTRSRGRSFSCWRYLEVSRHEMSEDLSSLDKFVDGVGPGPAVFAGADDAAELLLN